LASRFIYGTPGFEAVGVQAGVIHADGTITPVTGSPFSEGLGTPSIIEIVGDAKGRFIYVLNVEAQAGGELIGSPGLCGFATDSASGVLTLVPGSPIVFPVRNNNMISLDGSGRFLFEGNLSGTGFDVYSIDQNSGALSKTSAGSNAPPVGTFAAASPDGRFLFSAGNGMLAVFSIAPQTGNLAIVSGTPVSTRGSAGPVTASPDGRFLYLANQAEGTLMVFAVGANGVPVPVSGSPFAIDPGAQFLALTSNGRFLYIASFGAAPAVKGYAVDPSSGTLVPVAGAVVNNADSVTIDRSGTRAYITVGGNLQTPLELFVYAIDPATGVLTQIAAQANAPFSDDPNDVVTVP
jgi:6-phosphogluconolactonase (cycloisomerase 2 family)